MKLFILGFIVIFFGCAGFEHQNYAPISDFEQIFDSPGVKKDSLYNGLKIWISENFRSAKSVIEYDNKDQGVIIGNGAVNYPCSNSGIDAHRCDWKVLFTMKSEIKDEKFRATFSNLKADIPGQTSPLDHGYTPGAEINSFPQEKISEIKSILLNFGNEINKSISKNGAKNNW